MRENLSYIVALHFIRRAADHTQGPAESDKEAHAWLSAEKGWRALSEVTIFFRKFGELPAKVEVDGRRGAYARDEDSIALVTCG
jgi:hypothetical protein